MYPNPTPKSAAEDMAICFAEMQDALVEANNKRVAGNKHSLVLTNGEINLVAAFLVPTMLDRIPREDLDRHLRKAKT
jgi:hypothetical protein